MKSSSIIPFDWECYELTEFFDYMLPKQVEPTLYIFISHSGKSRLLIQCIEHLALLKVPKEQVWLVTNQEHPQIEQACGKIFPINVEKELVIGVKSFQNEILVLFLIAQLLINPNRINEDLFKNLSELPNKMEKFRDNWKKNIEKILEFLEYRLEFLYFISHDPASLACAKNSALRSKTYHGQFAEGISLGLFFHGPFQIFERNQSQKQGAIMLVGNRHLAKETEQPLLIRLVTLIRERAGRVIILSNNPALKEWFSQDPEILIIDFQAGVEELSPIFENFILALVFLQIAKRDNLLK